MARSKPEPLFRTPGKAVFREAFDWVAVAGTFAILFNTLHPSGIELKVGSQYKRTQPSADASSAVKTASYAGWNARAENTKKIPTTVTKAASLPKGATLADWQARFPHVGIIGARKAWDNQWIFLDARKPDDYADGHIAGAINFYDEDFDELASRILPALDPKKNYVIYCNGTTCDLSHHLAERLSQQGYNNLKVFFNGWSEWKKAAYPVKTGKNP
jgi:rhodanese-related sulfurtransferase